MPTTDSVQALEVRPPGRRGTMVFIPSFHGYGEFAAATRQAVSGCDAVALEMSADVAAVFVQLLRRHAPKAGDRLSGVMAIARTSVSASEDQPSLDYMPLVSTDSMCEAARRAIEMDISVFGVDLDTPVRPATAESPNAILVPDPLSIHDLSDLENYVGKLITVRDAFTSNADSDFDARNEHIARRLLDLSARFERVLVVVGLAHYPSLRQMLLDSRLTPLHEEDAPRTGCRLQPLVLSPQLAAKYMDRFPRLVDYYETLRCSLTDPNEGITLDYKAAMREAIDEAYQACVDPSRRKLSGRPLSLREMQNFETLLANASALANEQLPTLNTFVSVAQAAVERFAAPLVEALMRFPWLGPLNSPYPYLKPLPSIPAHGRRSIRVRLGTMEYVLTDADVFDCPGAKIYPEEENVVRLGGRMRTWPPEDRIGTIVALRLASLKRLQDEPPLLYKKILSLLDGIDIRETVRYAARGESLPLAVRHVRSMPERSQPHRGEDWPFPIVYVFDDSPLGAWQSWYAPLADPQGRRTLRNYHGIVGWGTTEYRFDVQRTTWSVVAHFTPLVWGDPDEFKESPRSLWQTWLEAGHWEEMPIGSSDITKVFPSLGQGPTLAYDLLRLALRHSQHATVVINPDYSRLQSDLRELADGLGKSITVFPTSLLPIDLLERIRTAHIVDWCYEDESLWRGGHAAPGVEEKMGESQHAFKEVSLGPFARPQV